MKKTILLGLLLCGNLANTLNANTQDIVQINQESFDLIKSALIRVLKGEQGIKGAHFRFRGQDKEKCRQSCNGYSLFKTKN